MNAKFKKEETMKKTYTKPEALYQNVEDVLMQSVNVGDNLYGYQWGSSTEENGL